MCTLKKKIIIIILSLLCSNWRNLGSFLFGFRLAEMFEPVFGLEYHLPSSMNSILTFQKKKKKLSSLLDSNLRNPGSFLLGLRARGNRWAFVWIGIPSALFCEFNLDLSKKNPISCPFQGCDLQHLCLAVLVRPFGSTEFATDTFVSLTLYHFTLSELRFSVIWIKVYNCF